MEIVITAVISPIIVAVAIYAGSSYWKKYISHKPKLYIDIPVILFSQTRGQGTLSDFTFCWKPQVKIKNNSSYTAYNIKLSFPAGYELLDGQPISSIFPANNHIDPNSEKEFELKTCLVKSAFEMLRITKEDNTFIVHPGRLIETPEETLKPDKTKDIKIYLEYENEKGGRFFTFYRNGENTLK